MKSIYKVTNKKTGQVTTTTAVSAQKAINNVRFTRKELYNGIAAYKAVLIYDR